MIAPPTKSPSASERVELAAWCLVLAPIALVALVASAVRLAASGRREEER